MSHWGQEKKVRDINDNIYLTKTFQEEDEELDARNFTASSAAGGIRTRTPLLHSCTHSPLRHRRDSLRKFPNPCFSIEIKVNTKLTQKGEREN